MVSVNETISINFLNGKLYIWDASDARTLREDFRIVSSLVGCLPRLPRQNQHLGLPAELMAEEAALLLHIGAAKIVKKEYEAPSPDEITRFQDERKDSYKQQVELFKRDRREEIRRNLPEILEGKKTKRNKRLEEKRQQGHHVEDAEFEAEVDVDPDKMDIPEIKPEHMLIQLPLDAAADRLTCHEVDWSFPNTLEETLRFKVFKHLWETGHYLTSGTKFGGDFLVYPGDPSRYHALFVAVCVQHEKPLTALDLIAMGRLGKTVKKTLVLCSIDDTGQLCYNSLQWTGIH